MFDIGWPEIFVVGVITLIVVGPKEIPHVLRNVMGWVKKARSLAREFQSGVDDMVREAELDKLKDNVVGGGEEALDFGNMIDPDGDAEKALDFDIPDLEAEFKDEIKEYKPEAVSADVSDSDAEESLDFAHDDDVAETPAPEESVADAQAEKPADVTEDKA